MVSMGHYVSGKNIFIRETGEDYITDNTVSATVE